MNVMKPRLLQLILAVLLLALPTRAVSPIFNPLGNLVTNCDATLVQSTNGLFFGTTLNDGPALAGSIFVCATNTTFRLDGGLTNLHTFVASDGGQSDGGVVFAPSGMLFGTTARLALSNNVFPGGMGSIYRMSQSGAFSVLYRFGTQTNALGQPVDGASSHATPVAPAGNTIYGTAYLGGAFGYSNGGLGFGTIFKVQTNGASFSVLHSFTGNDGANPTALIIGADQSLYGATSSGGANTTVQTNGATGYGTIFNITTNGDFTSLYSFGIILASNGVPLDGSQPNSIFQASNGLFYGTAARGGSHGRGTFFSITTNGSFTLLYSFGSITNSAGLALDGDNPNGALIQGADGNYYGVTQFGGTTNTGTIYRMTPQGELTTIYSFSKSYPSRFGMYGPITPLGGLLLGRDLNFYGTTYAGGLTVGAAGCIYEFGPGLPSVLRAPFSVVPATVIAGSTFTYSNNVNSVYPTDIRWLLNGTPLTDNATVSGSSTPNLTLTNVSISDSGTYTIVASNAAGTALSTNILTVVPLQVATQPVGTNIAAGATNTFKVAAKSNFPFTCQWQLSEINLADDTRISGTSTTNLTIKDARLSDAGNYSVVFSNSAGSVTSSNADLTVQPFLLITAPTNQNTLAGLPISFSITVQNFGPITYQWQFNGTNLTEGPNISGSTTSNLVLQPASLASSGTYTVIVSNAVGATNLSASLVVFPQTALGCVMMNLHSFSFSTSWEPNQLQLGADGIIYGTTVLGGAYSGQTINPGNGTFFRVDTNGTVTTLHSFDGLHDGENPSGQLALSTNGTFFGIAENYSYQPTVFNITTNGTVATLTIISNVTFPFGVTMGADNRLYVADYYGNIFTIDPASGAYAKLYSFGKYGYLYSALTLGPDGMLYGTTADKIFKMDYNTNVTVLYTFTNNADGYGPSSYFAWATNGDLYGVTASGGAFGCGTVFKLSTNAQLTTLHSFGQLTNADGTSFDGRDPLSLIWGPDGMLYGPTYLDGCNNSGTVFRISTNGDFETLVWFSLATGKSPCFGQLVVGSDNNIYGTTSYGGAQSNGTIYRINLVPTSQPITATWNGNTTISISAAAIPGHTYQLQSTSSLAPADWQDIGTPATGTSTVITFNDMLSDTQRFYRVALVQ